jgi:hypothetical protein
MMTGHSTPAGAAPFGTGPGLPPAAGDAAGRHCYGGTSRPLAGVALELDEERDQFSIALIKQGGGVAAVLGPFDESDVVAVWRSLGAQSGLPLLLRRPDGSLHAPYPQVGRLALGAVRVRRRHGLLAGRRPRFLVRRKTGRLSARPTVLRGQELVAQGR